MGKKIISQTIIFVVMIGLIVGFSVIFGSENTLIGVTTITAVLMLLSKDFSLNPLSTALKLICFNVLMGIVTFIAAKNVWLGIPLNFIFLFVMGYTLSYNLSSPSFVPFNLQYVFTLSTPITIAQLPKRLIALAVGAILVVLAQVIFNKNKISKQGNTVLVGVCSGLIDKLALLEAGKPFEELEQKVQQGIGKFRRFVYNKREQDFYLTRESRIKLDLSLELEKINDAINELALQEDAVRILNDQGFKEDFISVIDIVKGCLEKEENLNQLDESFSTVFDKYNAERNTSVFQLKVLNSLSFIKQSLYELKELDKSKYNAISKHEPIPANYQLKNIYIKSFQSNSLKFSYAFRLALGITISAFVVGFFKIAEGRWIVYTVNSLSQPFYEKSKQRLKDRLLATIIGVIIIGIVFSVIKGSTARTLTLMVISYFLSYNSAYRYTTINATVSAIGAAALYGNTFVLSLDRILFVATGAVLAILLSKFVFPYKVEDARKDLIDLYDKTIASQIDIVTDFLQKKKTADEAMKNEILRGNMIEERLLENEMNQEDKNLDKYLESQRSIAIGIADLYRWIKRHYVDTVFPMEEKAKIDQLLADKEEISYDRIESFINNSESTYSLSSKIAVINYIEIVTQMNRVKRLKASCLI